MGAISVEKASFASLWVETVLYVLYLICMYILSSRYRAVKSKAKASLVMMSVASALYALSSAHVIINLVRAIGAFIDDAKDAEVVLERISSPLSVGKQVVYVLSSLVADGLLIFRCFAVWGRSWKITAVPFVLFLGAIVTGFGTVYIISQATASGKGFFDNSIRVWGTAAYALSLLTNISVTGLIASRIWWMSRGVETHLGRHHSQVYTRIIALVIESGSIYSLSLIVFIIAYSLNTHGQKIANDALAQVVGIMPTFIIIRIGLGLEAHHSSSGTSGTGTTVSTGLHFTSPEVPVSVGLVDGERELSQSYSMTGTGSGSTPGGKGRDRFEA
ncbi:hypothetical protein BDV98DRAFT_275205 [Pterulicium gracile]|uniref:Uncharacterized protein n=1 Tax=Pterulicium gracile TaxID=1884261 RepID=A0A5C3Q9M8_9AGAR|nr:hypothetical protein BDV98DRAFT_275205 [Pterula gracilis]